MDHIYTHPAHPQGSIKAHGNWFVSAWETLSESQIVDYIHTIKLADRYNNTMENDIYAKALACMFSKLLR